MEKQQNETEQKNAQITPSKFDPQMKENIEC